MDLRVKGKVIRSTKKIHGDRIYYEVKVQCVTKDKDGDELPHNNIFNSDRDYSQEAIDGKEKDLFVTIEVQNGYLRARLS